jgi:hypothetical protein
MIVPSIPSLSPSQHSFSNIETTQANYHLKCGAPSAEEIRNNLELSVRRLLLTTQQLSTHPVLRAACCDALRAGFALT